MASTSDSYRVKNGVQPMSSFVNNLKDNALTIMTRLMLALFGLVFANITCFAEPERNLIGTKPNIIFILTDDQGYGDLSSHGNPILKTTNLDKLRGEAFRFLDFHVSPTCAPTRSALFTGRHEFKNGITHTILERERLTLDAVTLPQALQTAGYSTGIFGKWHLGDEEEYLPNRRGFNEMFIHGAGGIGQSYPGSCGDVPGNSYFDPIILHNDQLVKTKGYCTDIFFERATEWIKEQAKDQKRFFAYIATNAPHAPYHAKEADAALYSGKVPKEDVANFFGMIHNIDENIGRLRERLNELGIERDTLIVFMNDNGTAAGQTVFNAGMRGAKGSPWLGGTRANSLWCWPGVIQNRDSSEFVANIDFFSTIADIAGVEWTDLMRSQVEGRSLAAILQGTQETWPNRFLVTHVGRWPKGANPDDYKYSAASIRDNRWALVNPNGKPLANGESPKWQLFDLTNDYGQSSDIASEHPTVVKEMQDAIDKWWNDCRPKMINEQANGPRLNPFAVRYWNQFGGGPTEADYKRMDPSQGWPPRK
jgi:arylsulfatase